MKISKIIQVQQETNVDCKCDVCGKLAGVPYPKGWFNFSHQHSEWGNDSCDSIEHFDVCSAECFINKLQDSLHEMEDYKRTAKIAEMDYEFAQELLSKLLNRITER